MADDLTGKDIFVDLTVTGARTLRAEGSVRVRAIHVMGTAGAAIGSFTLRRTTASTGPVAFKLVAPIDSVHDSILSFGSQGVVFDKLFMDDLTNAWLVGSHMIIYTGESAT